jgi:hypothetical protein
LNCEGDFGNTESAISVAGFYGEFTPSQQASNKNQPSFQKDLMTGRVQELFQGRATAM